MESAFSASPMCFGAPLHVEMGTPVSSSLGSMGSLLGKLGLLLGHECKMQKGVKDEIKLLKETLDKSSNFLLKLSAVEDPNLTAKYWMKEVRELSYDIEDYFDKLMHGDASDANIGSVRKYTGPEIARLPKAVKRRISKFRTRVQEAIQRHERYKIRDSTFRPMYVSVGPQLPTVYAETAGLLDDPFNELVKWLTDGEEQQLKVVSIVGSGGLGKSTLVKRLYKNLGGAFECRAFVRVSQKPDMMRLLWSMLSQVQRQQPRDTREVQDLLDNLREHLQDKRYLIVIDNIWTVPIWDILYHAFPEGRNHGSRIITTTQIEDVALACCSSHTENIFKMEPLSDGNSRKLFFSRVFGSEDACTEQFKEVSYEIIKKCGGLPLATINVASFLATQPVMLMEQWKHVVNSLGSNLRANPISEGMRQVLNLSYANLPHYLKTCLLYLSTYPDDYTIQKDDLVKQWVAEGFINAVKGQEMDETASSYFDELVNRRMIQPINVNYNDEVLSCTLHDNVIDLVAHRAMEENFITVIDYSQTNIGFSDKVRRLSLHFDNAKYAITPAGLRLSQVRSLAFFGLRKCMPSVLEFKLLRVLILEFWGNPENSADFTEISILIQLRYIKITCNVTVELPARMQGLQYLETLEIDARVRTVPSDIVQLPFLSHICLPADTSLPNGIGHMRALRTLQYFDLSNSSQENVRSLGELTNLQNLHLTNLQKPWQVHRNMNDLGLLLEYLGNLKSVILVTRSSDTTISCDGWRDVSTPPLLLERLELAPRVCIFSRFPDWITHLDKLCTLKIMVRELLQIDIDILAGLPSLTILSLNVRTAPVGRIVFCSMAFPLLKCFKFRCTLPCLTFEAGALPKLRRLKLGFHAHEAEQYSPAHVGIEHLLSLEEVTGVIGGSGSNEAALSALKDTIKVHPNRPSLSFHCVDSIFHAEEADSRTTQKENYGTQEKHRETQENDSNEQHLTQENVSNKQHGVQEINSEEDMNEQSDRSYENETNEQHETEENDSNEQHRVQELNSEEDMKKQIDRSYENETNEQYETQENDSNKQHGVQELNSGEEHETEENDSNEQHGVQELNSEEDMKKQIDSSYENETNEQYETQENDSKKQHGVQELNSGEDMNKQTDSRSSHLFDPSETSPSYIPGSDREISPMAEIVKMPADVSSPNLNLDRLATSTSQVLNTGTEGSQYPLCSSQGFLSASSHESSITVDFELFWRLRKYLVLLGILAVSVTCNAGLTPPGGFWTKNSNGHDAGDPVLRVHFFQRYEVFFYCNATAFAASLVLTILLLSMGVTRQNLWICSIKFTMTLDLFSLMGAYAAGSFGTLKSSIYILVLVFAVFIYVVIRIGVFIRVFPDWFKDVVLHQILHRWAVHKEQRSNRQERDVEEARKFILILANFAAAVTYRAGLRPPGGFWAENDHNHRPAISVLQSYHLLRYNIFVGCNSTSFVASLVTIILLLSPELSSRGIRLKAVLVCIVADLLCLIGAYAAGCSGDTVTSFYVMFITGLVLVCIAILVSILFYKRLAVWLGNIKSGTLKWMAQFGWVRSFKFAAPAEGTASEPERQSPGNQQVSNTKEGVLEIEMGDLTKDTRPFEEDFKTKYAKDSMSNPEPERQFAYNQRTTNIKKGVLEIEMGDFTEDTRPFKQDHIDNNQGAPDEKADGNPTDEYLKKSRTNLLLLAILAVSQTYQSGLNPPGGFWSRSEDRSAGDPILEDTARFKASFYFNETTFVASIVMIVMLLRKNLRMLQVAMVVDVIHLTGAFITGSCTETKKSIYTAVLICLVLSYVAVHVLTVHHVIPKEWKKLVSQKLKHFLCRGVWSELPHFGHNQTGDIIRESGKVLFEKRRNLLLILAILAAVVTYQAGMNPPGGVWSDDKVVSGKPGNPILQDNYPNRYDVYYYSNSVSFVLSVCITTILLVNKESCELVTQSSALGVCLVVGLVGLLIAYAAGSCRKAKQSIYVIIIYAAVLLSLAIHTLLFSSTLERLIRAKFVRKETASELQENSDRHEKKGRKTHKYLMLLATSAASITYQAGLNPPGGFWSDYGGRVAGNPVLRYVNLRRYKTFFCFNAISFMASIVVIMLLLNKSVRKKIVPLKVLHLIMMVDMLALMTAFAAGISASVRVYFLLTSAVACVVCVLIPFAIRLGKWRSVFLFFFPNKK